MKPNYEKQKNSDGILVNSVIGYEGELIPEGYEEYEEEEEIQIEVDEVLNADSTNPIANSAVTNELNKKQNTLTAGSNITISNDVISASTGVTAAAILNLVYPVGSIYISVNTTNPSTFIGGTWTKLSANYYLMSSANGGGGTSSSNTRNISHTHSFNTAIASHSGTGHGCAYTAGSYVWAPSGAIGSAGSTSLNIQPASIAVCMWRRTA